MSFNVKMKFSIFNDQFYCKKHVMTCPGKNSFYQLRLNTLINTLGGHFLCEMIDDYLILPIGMNYNFGDIEHV